MTSTTSLPSKQELIEAIKAAGSDNADFFGYPEKQDGLFLQQDPEEYAAYVHFMVTECEPSKFALDIGIASGGQTKFIRDYYPVENTVVVDIGQHPNFKHWDRIKKLVKGNIVEEIIDDSHAPQVREKLLPYAGKFDFSFIDGDHSYRGLKQDLFLARELLQPGAIVVLHDTTEVKDCHKVFLELEKSDNWELLRNFESRFGISIWRFTPGEKGRSSSILNRKYGIGQL